MNFKDGGPAVITAVILSEREEGAYKEGRMTYALFTVAVL